MSKLDDESYSSSPCRKPRFQQVPHRCCWLHSRAVVPMAFILISPGRGTESSQNPKGRKEEDDDGNLLPVSVMKGG